MKAGLRGDVRALKQIARTIKTLPRKVEPEIAARVAPELTRLAGGAYDAGRTVYGSERPDGVRGNALDLVATGRVRASLAFVASGRTVRCVLPTSYAKYLIGKYDILPLRHVMPTPWANAIDVIAGTEINAQLGRAAA